MLGRYFYSHAFFSFSETYQRIKHYYRKDQHRHVETSASYLMLNERAHSLEANSLNLNVTSHIHIG